MKFKKVEIQAFRAYDKVEDATFDFQIGDQRNADFVSIYAPNGFGKTSFYDAVEWGYTSNIHRFLKKQKFNLENSKSQRNINSDDTDSAHKSKYQILRNHNSALTTEGFVRLFTTNSDKPTVRNIPTPRSGTVDYKFDSSETVNDYFQKVILSQEWIDAFLKEDDASERYKTFISYFGNQQLDKYYTTIVNLIRTVDLRIKKLAGDLKGVQKEIQFNGDQEILLKVNDKIKELRGIYPALNLIDTDFSEPDYVQYDSQLIELLHSLTFEINKNNGIQDVLKLAFQGDEQVIGLERYETNQARITELKNQLSEYRKTLDDFDQLSKLNEEIKSLLNSLANTEMREKAAREILLVFPKFELIQQEISHGALRLDEMLKNSRAAEQETAKIEGDILKVQEEETNKLNLIAACEESKKNAKALQEKSKSDLPQESKLNQTHVSLEKDITKLNEKIHKAEQEITRIQTDIANLNVGKYPNTSEEQHVKYLRLIEAARKHEKESSSIGELMEELEAKIEQRKAFNEELEKFVALGAAMVDKNQASTCPLCNQDFKTYTELANRISNNSLLSEELKGLLQRRSSYQQQRTNIHQQVRQLRSEIQAGFEAELQQQDAAFKKNQAERSQLEKSLSETLEQLATIAQTKLRLSTLLGAYTFEGYLSEMDRQIAEHKEQVSQVKTRLTTLQKQLSENKAQISTLKKQLELFSKQEKEIAGRAEYVQVEKYFAQELKGEVPGIEAFNKHLEYLKKSKETLERELTDKRAQVTNISIPHLGKNRVDTEAQFNNLADSITGLEEAVNNYESFLMREFNYFPGIEEVSAKAFLLEYDTTIKNNIQRDEKIRLDLRVLMDQLKAVMPFLKFQESKKKETGFREKMSFLKDNVRKRLNLEKNKVAAHLDKEIGSFFYQDLINDLYEKIDPHPTYRKIKFLCDFKEDKPKLNVCVVGESGEEMLIPTLYFSTAQLNILSLSIFLAKALNVSNPEGEQVDCIFIDDPIQSMDSINILSTIDLLRSLVKNNKKQIILSTHDENFHNLLQKKLPTDLFKSKYIELETFGKVRKNETDEQKSQENANA